MFSRPNRLRRSQDIVRAMRRGHRLDTPYVTLYWHKQPEQQLARFAFIVGKKVSPSAVKRHRLQRWLRVAARPYLLHHNSAYDMVWVARPNMVRCKSLAELEQTLTPALKKANLIA